MIDQIQPLKALYYWPDNTHSMVLETLVDGIVPLMALNVIENQSVMLVASSKEKAEYWYSDLKQLDPENRVFYFPQSHQVPYQIEETPNANAFLRAETLRQIIKTKQSFILVTHPEALFEKIPAQQAIIQSALQFNQGDNLALDFLNETLYELQFKRVDFVSKVGEFSVRGGIVDVFSYGYEKPFRINFFGNEIDSIRWFEVGDQMSFQTVQSVELWANPEVQTMPDTRLLLWQWLPKPTMLMAENPSWAMEQLDKLEQNAHELFDQKKDNTIKPIAVESLYSNAKEWLAVWKNSPSLVWGAVPDAFKNSGSNVWNITPQPPFHKNFDLLLDHFTQHLDLGYQIYIFIQNDTQHERLKHIFEQLNTKVQYTAIIGHWNQGFIDHTHKILAYTDHQIFDRYLKSQVQDRYSAQTMLSLDELNNLNMGDYVTHIDHGIGKFSGLQKIEVNGKIQEAIKLVYHGGDLLYVNIHSLHKISKFKGKDGSEPKINKLGSPTWRALKQKTKTRVKALAFDLIKLYAARKTRKGHAFSADSVWQEELEASFIYEDTPDQLKATQEVKADMESPIAMDRLICGDVGFGKTEVAIRAAFKAAMDGKQVAVLVPTTVLAFQHFRSFRDRLADFPVTVDYVSRFRSEKDRKSIIQKVQSGQIDILIGTHQMVSESFGFKNLGLLIVDEEHKFGVGVKEKLKSLKSNLDTLTLTATPIPRTLQFSLMSARDLSVMRTPPPNRQPVDTRMMGFNEAELRDAIAKEIMRGGQVYYIFNNIENQKTLAGTIQRLVPDAKITTAHGQMDGKTLEKIMLDFMNGHIDVLVSTTIVESGLDVPNANTIFIQDAQNFGLADLHQMRGRVGRSNQKAYCYLITPPMGAVSSESKKRLEAMVQFSDLGSGFSIAMKDLEIRGAGNLLGPEQSGFINDIGFDTYQKLLQEAVAELRQDEFSDLFTDQAESVIVSDFQMDTDLDLYIPDDYVNQVNQRFLLYKQLADITTPESLDDFKTMLVDRFGPVPEEVVALLKSIQLKWLAQALGMEKMIIKNQTALTYFISDAQSVFFQSDVFTHILQSIAQMPGLVQLKEKKSESGAQLYLKWAEVKSIEAMIERLNRLLVV